MELTPEHLSRLDEMVTLLSISDDLTIAFARCNEPILRDALYAEIKDRVHDEIFIYDIAMDRNSTNLLQLLNDAVKSDIYNSKIEDNKKIAFFVSGLNEAIEKKTDEGRSEALALLNMMREDFLNIGHTIIIWINTASLSMILKEAQDYFSWRTTVFEFDMARRKQINQVFEIGDTDLVFLNKDELEERWYNYSRLLREYQEKGIEDPYKFADWNYNLGMIKILMGYAAEAMEYFEKSLVLSEKAGAKNGIANSLGRLGNACRDLGQVKKAIQYHKQALTISEEIGDLRSEGIHFGNLGNDYYAIGQVEKAIEYYNNTLDISKRVGARRSEGLILGDLGNAFYSLNNIEKAIEHYNQALEIIREIGDKRSEGIFIGNIGNAYGSIGQIEEAIKHYKQALDIAIVYGDIPSEGAAFGNLGNIYSDNGQVEKAIKCHMHALEIARKIGDRRTECVIRGNLGSAYYRLGQNEKAIEYYIRALEIGKEIGDKRTEGAILGNLGNIYSRLGNPEKAIEYYEQTLVIGKETKDSKLVDFFRNKLDSLIL